MAEETALDLLVDYMMPWNTSTMANPIYDVHKKEFIMPTEGTLSELYAVVTLFAELPRVPDNVSAKMSSSEVSVTNNVVQKIRENNYKILRVNTPVPNCVDVTLLCKPCDAPPGYCVAVFIGKSQEDANVAVETFNAMGLMMRTEKIYIGSMHCF